MAALSPVGVFLGILESSLASAVSVSAVGACADEAAGAAGGADCRLAISCFAIWKSTSSEMVRGSPNRWQIWMRANSNSTALRAPENPNASINCRLLESGMILVKSGDPYVTVTVRLPGVIVEGVYPVPRKPQLPKDRGPTCSDAPRRRSRHSGSFSYRRG